MSMMWMVTDHLCRHCGVGRVLTRKNEYGQWIAKCSSCGTCRNTVKEICFCGSTYKKTEAPVGLRCVRNPEVTPENPHEVVVERFEVEKPKAKVRPTYSEEW